MHVSIELAKRLKDLHLNWGTVHQGDFYWDSGQIHCWAGFDAFPNQQLRPSVHAVFLPRFDQVIDKIRRLVPACTIIFGSYNDDETGPPIFCDVVINDYKPSRICWEGTGPNDTEAAGQALAQLMEAQNVVA